MFSWITSFLRKGGGELRQVGNRAFGEQDGSTEEFEYGGIASLLFGTFSSPESLDLLGDDFFLTSSSSGLVSISRPLLRASWLQGTQPMSGHVFQREWK